LGETSDGTAAIEDLNDFDSGTICVYNLSESEGCDFLGDALHSGEILLPNQEFQGTSNSVFSKKAVSSQLIRPRNA